MVNLSKLFLPKIIEGIYRFLLIGLCSCFFYPLASSMNLLVIDGEEVAMSPSELDGNYNKVGGGTLIWRPGISLPGDITVSEGTLQNESELSGLLTIKDGGTYRSSTVAKIVENGGELQTSKIDDLSPESLALTILTQTSNTASVLSIKIFPNGTSDPKNFCDYFNVTSAILTGKLAVYVAPGNYDQGGVRYPIIRSSVPESIAGDFISLINMNHENVVLTHQQDDSNYYLVVSGGVPYVPPTQTSYTIGKRLNKNQRHDTVKIGGTGGFSGFETPEDWCEVLVINFIQTGTPAEQNTILTNISDLPDSVEEVWLTGDPTGYDVMVQGGRQFALPTPGKGTRIRFAFTESPASNPLGWFQTDLPRDCGVFIEPGSANPFINSVLPIAGGYMVIGAPIPFGPGVAGLLVDSMPFSIQKHTDATVEESCITLTEDTPFPGLVSGIKLRGAASATFKEISPSLKVPYHSLFNISEETAVVGLRAFGCIVKLYKTPDYAMPAVKDYCVGGNVLTTTDSIESALAPKIPGFVINPLREFS